MQLGMGKGESLQRTQTTGITMKPDGHHSAAVIIPSNAQTSPAFSTKSAQPHAATAPGSSALCRCVQSHSASCSLPALPGDTLRLCEGHHQGHCRVTLVTE